MKRRQRTSHKDAGNSQDKEKNPSKNAKSDHDELLHTSFNWFDLHQFNFITLFRPNTNSRHS